MNERQQYRMCGHRRVFCAENVGKGYEVGTYQPAVMVVVLDADFQLLFSWSSVPTASNIGDAKDCPHPDIGGAPRPDFN